MRHRKVTNDHKDFDLGRCVWERLGEGEVGGQVLGHISFEVPANQPSEMLSRQSSRGNKEFRMLPCFHFKMAS